MSGTTAVPTLQESGPTLQEYLTAKSELQLRNYLVKMEGGAARLNGSRVALVERIVLAFCGLGRERQNEVMPGLQRARQNWRRSANLATMLSLPPRPGQLALHPAPPPTFLLAAPHGGVRPRHPPTMRSSVGHVRASRGEVPPRPLAEAAPTTSAATLLTPRPIGRSRQRSRSMASPSTLMEEYKQRWTCKVCLASEVTILIQPCGHLCLCEPCSLAIHRHFREGRLRDLMFGGSIPPTPCPICRGPIQSGVKVFV